MPYGRTKKGTWKVIDEQSGLTVYSDKVRQDYLGRYVDNRHADYENPQNFIQSLDDPQPLPFTNPPDTDFRVANKIQATIGKTDIPTPIGPGNGIYEVTSSVYD